RPAMPSAHRHTVRHSPFAVPRSGFASPQSAIRISRVRPATIGNNAWGFPVVITKQTVAAASFAGCAATKVGLSFTLLGAAFLFLISWALVAPLSMNSIGTLHFDPVRMRDPIGETAGVASNSPPDKPVLK